MRIRSQMCREKTEYAILGQMVFVLGRDNQSRAFTILTFSKKDI